MGCPKITHHGETRGPAFSRFELPPLQLQTHTGPLEGIRWSHHLSLLVLAMQQQQSVSWSLSTANMHRFQLPCRASHPTSLAIHACLHCYLTEGPPMTFACCCADLRMYAPGPGRRGVANQVQLSVYPDCIGDNLADLNAFLKDKVDGEQMLCAVRCAVLCCAELSLPC
jgi:hypothetical protein